jgi:DNA polymerase I
MMSSFLTQNEEEPVNFADSVEWEVVRTNERVREVAAELSKESMLAIDTENAGLDPQRKIALLLQIGTSDKCYIFEHYAGLDLSPIKELLENENILNVLFNAKYDWKWILFHYGIRMNNIFCCQVTERVLTVGLPGGKVLSSLRDVVKKYLGITLKKEARSAFINRDPISNPITDEEFAYSAADVVLLPDICLLQIDKLNSTDMQIAAQLEFDVLPPTAESELLGILIDQEQWRANLAEAKRKYDELSVEIYKCFEQVVAQKTLFGVPTFKLSSNQQLLKNLEKLGFTLDNTEADTLKNYVNEHEVFKLLLPWRGYSRVLTTYGEKLLSRINPKTGRLHCQFNQVRAATGRMSAEKPALQTIPGYNPKDPTSLDFRSCFIAKPGYLLVTADFSQQELRILADMSGDPTFSKAYTELDEEGKTLDVHAYTASVIFDTPYKEVTETQRKKAKTLNFFLVYGGGYKSLAASLEITEQEAEQIIADYFGRYSHIKRLLDSFGASALNTGYVQTISGRKRYLLMPPDLIPDSKEYKKERASIKRQAGNTPIQGSGSDVTKKAMVFVHRRLLREGFDARILLVVHDELVVEAREDQAPAVAKIVEEEMIRAFTHFFKNIPMKVDAHIGPTWEK